MQRQSGSIHNKLMLACAMLAAAVLATPAAMAHDYRGHGDDSGKLLGALVVGAVIGGVLVSASEHHDRYYDGGYYSAPAYPQQGYYGGEPAAYSYPSYPAYSYGNGGYYHYPSYAGSVNVGVVYSDQGGRWRGRDGHYYGGSRGHYRDDQVYGRGYDRDRGRYYRRHGY